jgi:type VI secretion system protein VasG
VGYGKGGVLTEAVRHNPYCLVLFEEVEKAHPDVMELFYQVFDKGTLEDAEGITVDFKNTIILLTSNVGADTIVRACRRSQTPPDAEGLAQMIRPELLLHFKPALLGRMVVAPYYPLGPKEIRKIVRLKLERIQDRFMENHRAKLTYDEKLVNTVAELCAQEDSGARDIDHILTNTMLPDLSSEILNRMALGESFEGVHVSMVKDKGFSYKFFGTSFLPTTPSYKWGDHVFDPGSGILTLYPGGELGDKPSGRPMASRRRRPRDADPGVLTKIRDYLVKPKKTKEPEGTEET